MFQTKVLASVVNGREGGLLGGWKGTLPSDVLYDIMARIMALASLSHAAAIAAAAAVWMMNIRHYEA